MAKAEVVITAVDRTQQAIQSAQKGMKGLNDTALILKKTLGTVSAAAATAFVGRTITQAIEFGDQINKAATRAGIATETLSELSYAARLSGVEMGALVKSLQFMQKGLVEASMGTGEAKRALDLLGLSAKDVSGMSTQKQFEFFADKIAGIADPSQKAYVAMRIFGEAGVQLLPMLEQGAAGLQKFAEEAQKLGLSFSKEELDKLTNAKDSVDKLSMAWQGFATTLTSLVAPALTSVLNEIAGLQPAEVQLTRAIAEVERLKTTLAGLPGDGGKFGEGLRAQLAAQIEIIRKLQESTAAETAIKPTIISSPDQIKRDENALKRFRKNFFEIMDEIKKSADVDLVDAMGIKELNKEFEQVTFKALGITAENEFKILDELASAAAQNIQSSFANFLFDPFSNGLKGMLKGFIDTIRRMIAEIAASMILTKFFDWMSNLGGFWGKIGSAAVTSLTGKAMGGSVMGGTPYMVGERGPELFVPGSNGSIVPNDRMGGTTIAPVYNIDARGATADLQKALPGILQENNRRIFDELDRRYGIGR